MATLAALHGGTDAPRAVLAQELEGVARDVRVHRDGGADHPREVLGEDDELFGRCLRVGGAPGQLGPGTARQPLIEREQCGWILSPGAHEINGAPQEAAGRGNTP
jgi:hypothetical protein